MKGELRKEFIERVEAIFDGDRMFPIEEEMKYLIHELCDEIENRLLHVCDELKRIDAIRNTLEELTEVVGTRR